MRWALVGRYSKFSEEAELTKPPWPAAAEKGDGHLAARAYREFSFVYHLSREKDPPLSEMLSMLCDQWQTEALSAQAINSAAAGKTLQPQPAAPRRRRVDPSAQLFQQCDSRRFGGCRILPGD